jgi:rare lipoprotein A
MSRTPTTVIAIAAMFISGTLIFSLTAAKEPPNNGAQTGAAACYNRRLRGHRTSSGQRYNPKALTAAHATIPVGTHVKITNMQNGKSVVVLINDHLSSGRIIMDLSQRACKELHFPKGGEAQVKLEVETSNTAMSH